MPSHDERRLIGHKLKELKQLLEQRSAPASNDTRNLSSNPKTYRRRRIAIPKLFVDGRRFLKPRPPRPWEKEVTFNMDSSSGSEVEGLPYMNSDEEEELEQAGHVDSDDEEVMSGGLGHAVDGSMNEQMELASSDRNEKIGTIPARRVTRSGARASQTSQSLEEDADDEHSVDGEQEDAQAPKQGNPTVSNRKRKEP